MIYKGQCGFGCDVPYICCRPTCRLEGDGLERHTPGHGLVFSLYTLSQKKQGLYLLKIDNPVKLLKCCSSFEHFNDTVLGHSEEVLISRRLPNFSLT